MKYFLCLVINFISKGKSSYNVYSDHSLFEAFLHFSGQQFQEYQKIIKILVVVIKKISGSSFGKKIANSPKGMKFLLI